MRSQLFLSQWYRFPRNAKFIALSTALLAGGLGVYTLAADNTGNTPPNHPSNDANTNPDDHFGPGPDTAARAPQTLEPSAGIYERGPADIRMPAIDFKGSIAQYNLAPNGDYQSMIIKTGNQNVQLNFSHEIPGTIPQDAPIGAQVKAAAVAELGMPDHPVYRLVTLSTTDGKRIALFEYNVNAKIEHAQGTVKTLNYDRHGMIDGVVLDNGSFVHFGPEAQYRLNLKVGDRITADGRVRSMANGAMVMEPQSINGAPVAHHPMAQGQEHPRDHMNNTPNESTKAGPGASAAPNTLNAPGPEARSNDQQQMNNQQ